MDDIAHDLSEPNVYLNCVLPDVELDAFAAAFAKPSASFDQEAIAETMRIINAAGMPAASETQPDWSGRHPVESNMQADQP